MSHTGSPALIWDNPPTKRELKSCLWRLHDTSPGIDRLRARTYLRSEELCEALFQSGAILLAQNKPPENTLIPVVSRIPYDYPNRLAQNANPIRSTFF